MDYWTIGLLGGTGAEADPGGLGDVPAELVLADTGVVADGTASLARWASWGGLTLRSSAARSAVPLGHRRRKRGLLLDLDVIPGVEVEALYAHVSAEGLGLGSVRSNTGTASAALAVGAGAPRGHGGLEGKTWLYEGLDLGDGFELFVGWGVLVPALGERAFGLTELVLLEFSFVGGLNPAGCGDRAKDRLEVLFVDGGAALVHVPVVGRPEKTQACIEPGTARVTAQRERELVVVPRGEVHEGLVVLVAVLVDLAQEIDSRDRADSLEHELVRHELAHEVVVSCLGAQIASVDPGNVQAQGGSVGRCHQGVGEHRKLSWVECLLVICCGLA